MRTDLRLQRLAYPSRGESVKQAEFGPSVMKFGAIKEFFTCAAMAQPNFAGGQIQTVLDNLYNNRREVVGHAVDVEFRFAEACTNFPQYSHASHTRPLYVLGEKDKLRTFEKSLRATSAAYSEDSPLIISGLREFMIADFMSKSAQHGEGALFDKLLPTVSQNLHIETMGWLDLQSGCFAMRSMNGLKRVRELFGMRPHMAIKKQRSNYPLVDFELPEPE